MRFVDIGLVVHALGIYIFFLAWGIYQEKISTTSYNGKYFNNFVFLSFLQSVGGICVSYVSMKLSRRSLSSHSKSLVGKYFKCSILHIISSQMGYLSLKFIDYPVLIIGKSCKLIPVVLMNYILYGKKFQTKKYVSILLTTLGILSFMMFEDKKRKSNSNSFIGILLLLGNLTIDGAINSIQDNIFKSYQIDSFHMMFYSNLFSACSTFLYLLSPLSSQLEDSVKFIKTNPLIGVDLFCFSVFNVLGQMFVYSTIKRYGSVSLITVTVTRKLFSIILSLVYFKHSLNSFQWMSILTVFTALGIELVEKRTSTKKIE
jgi:UDP-galactose transporter B1